MSTALTEGIRVTVASQYLPDRSLPQDARFAFAYTVRIANEGAVQAKLVSRHWVITDGMGHVQDVRGDGVVGAQPRLQPGEHFEYTSWCMLATPHGTMQGEYQMVRADGTQFEAEIAPFLLAVPNSLN